MKSGMELSSRFSRFISVPKWRNSMDGFKKVLKAKIFWIGMITLFFIYQAVNANKEAHSDLLDEYYNESPLTADSQDRLIKEAKNLENTISIKGETQSKEIKNISKADSITTYALTLLGRGYEYGKIGPNTFDCSGFIYHVFREFNISLPHSSRAMSKLGDALERDEIEVGDLLFFKSPTAGNPNVGHAGIVIESENGKIKFVHSSSNRGVVIDSLESNHYGKRFMWARSIL